MTGFEEAEWEQLALDTLAKPQLWRPVAGEAIAPESAAVSAASCELVMEQMESMAPRYSGERPG